MAVQQSPSLSSVATDPLRVFKFEVLFHPGQALASSLGVSASSSFSYGFMTVSGPAINIEVIPYREGGDNVTTRKMPGQADFGAITMSHGVKMAASQMDILAARFSGAGWEVPRLLKAMRTAPDFFFDPIAQVRLDCWSSRRAALVGDAGYCPTPLTGLGTSLALVGAYVLAGELAAADGDHRVAFARYEQITRPYVTRGQQLPPGGIKGYAPDSAIAIGLRTASMRWMSRWPIRNLLARQFAKASDIELPDYTTRAMR